MDKKIYNSLNNRNNRQFLKDSSGKKLEPEKVLEPISDRIAEIDKIMQDYTDSKKEKNIILMFKSDYKKYSRLLPTWKLELSQTYKKATVIKQLSDINKDKKINNVAKLLIWHVIRRKYANVGKITVKDAVNKYGDCAGLVLIKEK